MKKMMTDVWSFTKELYQEWSQDNCSQQAAALSYYTLFSLAPMLLIALNVASYFLGRESVSGELFTQARKLIGAEGAKGLENMVQSAYRAKEGWLPTIIGVGTLLFSATVTFASMQESLNVIFKVKANPRNGWWRLVINRVVSFSMVMGVGFFLVVSLVLDSLVAILGGYIQRMLGEGSLLLIQALKLGISALVLVGLFGIIFKFLPDVRLAWRHVWRPAIFTALLFTLGKYLIGLYIGQSNLASSYGAAASVVVIVLWINYASWIFFLGAEYAYVSTRRRGGQMEPSPHAIRVERVEYVDDKPTTETAPT